MTRTNMKKFIGSIKRSSVVQSRSKDSRNGVLDQPQFAPDGDHPEAVVVREVMAFCEAGAPGSGSAGDEYLHLPAIVDAAESSPNAAKEAALCLQRYLSKQNFERGYAQYNAIMLLRILTDNPGHVFTQNFDKSFVSTFKTLLRECRDTSVQQIARETLDYIEAEKLNANDTVMPLVEMWRKEKGGSARMYSTGGRSYGSGPAPYLPHLPPRVQGSPRGLPPPEELAARIEESRTSARLLVQMIQSTPPEELIGNELIKEFAERARQAHKSIQNFMACENPSPDENTMLTLIETSEQLGIAMNKHQRAVLQARKAAGGSANVTPQPQTNSQDPFSTAAMQNALPPSQPQQSQQPQRSVYDPYPAAAANNFLPPPQTRTPAQSQPQRPHTDREESDLYGSSQPQPQAQQQQSYPQYNSYNQREEQDLYGNNGSVSSMDPHEQSYLPPPGPPPPRHQQPQTYHNQPSQPAPPAQPTYGAPPVKRHSPTATRDYDVSENPFADDNAYSSSAQQPASQQYQRQVYEAPSQPPPQQSNNPHSIFNRAAGQLRDPHSPTQTSNRPVVSELDSSNYPAPPPQTRPGPRGYHDDWQPTPSFVQRQDSSTAHITMSGASPPPQTRS